MVDGNGLIQTAIRVPAEYRGRTEARFALQFDFPKTGDLQCSCFNHNSWD